MYIKLNEQYFAKPYERGSESITAELDLSNNARKVDLKRLTDVDTSNLASKSDLPSLKAEIDEKDIDDS